MTNANARPVEESISSLKPKCDCASAFEVKLVRVSDYAMFKRCLDVGRHPAFIGRSSFERNAANGGALFYLFGGEIAAVSLINPHYGILLALNVRPAHRSHGLGGAVVRFLVPNFVRALEDKVPWFERRGYRCVGKLKKGISLNTQLMVREALFTLAGKITKAWNVNACPHCGSVRLGGGSGVFGCAETHRSDIGAQTENKQLFNKEKCTHEGEIDSP